MPAALDRIDRITEFFRQDLQDLQDFAWVDTSLFDREIRKITRKKTWVATSFLTTNLTNRANLSWDDYSDF
jgi:hypothetical protein